MSAKRWILKCKDCRSECVYAEIATEGIASYFLPRKPEVPDNFTHTCPTCGHEDTYKRTDLVYQDDAIAPNHATATCAEHAEPKAKAQNA